MSTIHNSVQYREILGWPGYRIGDDGSVQCCRNRGGWGTYGNWRNIRLVTKRNGYIQVTLSNSGYKRALTVHHLVLEAFVGPRPLGMEARHLDGKRNNNAIENLEWSTHIDNEQDKRQHGTLLAGIRHHATKHTDDQIREIRAKRERGASQNALAREYGLDQAAIWRIIHRRTWKHVE